MSKLTVSIFVLVAVFLAGMWAHAQTVTIIPGSGQGSGVFTPTVYSGADLGFRVEVRKGNTPVGRLVVRINGEWVPVQDSIDMRQLTVR
jgi:hypothetical protein